MVLAVVWVSLVWLPKQAAPENVFGFNVQMANIFLRTVMCGLQALFKPLFAERENVDEAEDVNNLAPNHRN